MQDLAPQELAIAEWRLIIDERPEPGAWNMALDEAIMDAVASGSQPPTLRFYQWNPACLSLGKRQPLSGVDLNRCRAEGVEVVRRATGGWAILHTDELTYSIATLPDDPRASGAILDAYRSLNRGLIAGLHQLGVSALMNPVQPGGAANASAACFEVPSAYEIVVNGRKLIGSAQTRPAGRVLQHGSLPLRGDIGRVSTFLHVECEAEREALAAHLREHATTLELVLGRTVSFAEAAAALVSGFAEALHLRLRPAAPSTAERQAARALMSDKIIRDPARAEASNSIADPHAAHHQQ